jgi:hypothetical protein
MAKLHKVNRVRNSLLDDISYEKDFYQERYNQTLRSVKFSPDNYKKLCAELGVGEVTSVFGLEVSVAEDSVCSIIYA